MPKKKKKNVYVRDCRRMPHILLTFSDGAKKCIMKIKFKNKTTNNGKIELFRVCKIKFS